MAVVGSAKNGHQTSLMATKRAPLVKDYQVAWISAIGKEYTIARAVLDVRYEQPPDIPDNDDQAYTFGRIGNHNVVIASLPKGRVVVEESARLATDLTRSFPQLRFGFMVGIAGGAPNLENDVRLGDVVVSIPDDKRRLGGVVHYGCGASIQEVGFVRRGSHNAPPQVLLSAVAQLQQEYENNGVTIDETVQQLVESKKPKLDGYARPDTLADILFHPTFIHQDVTKDCIEHCYSKEDNIILRQARTAEEPQTFVHYGIVGSASNLMRDATLRDKIAAEDGVLCFEMESAGLMNNKLGWLVVRGICDYSDTHKNDLWQKYAAAVAAVYTKQLLAIVRTRKNDARLCAIKDEENQKPKILDVLRYLDMNTKHMASMPDITYIHDWIWSTPFLDWLSSPDSTFWICGKPGSGKSTLMAYLLHNKRTSTALCARGTDFKIINFFYDYRSGDSTANNVHGMLRMLLYQMAEQSQRTKDFLQTLLNNDSIDIESERGLLNACCEALNSLGPSFCFFIDGLDEYQGNVIELVQTCRQITERTGVKLCLASRPEARVPEIFPQCPQLLMQDNNQDSMKSYSRERLLQLENSNIDIGFRFHDSLRDSLIAKAEGIILWFKLTFGEIVELFKQQASDEEILRRVEQLPCGMDSLYERILNAIPPQERSGAALMLFLVAELGALPQPTDESFWDVYHCTDRIPATNLEHVFGAFKFVYAAAGHQFRFKRYSDFSKWTNYALRGLVENRGEGVDLIVASNRKREAWEGKPYFMRRPYLYATPGQFRYVHKTFGAYLRKSSWVEKNLDLAIKLRYPRPFMLNLTADVIHTAATSKLFDPNQVTECLRERALKQVYWKDVSRASADYREKALVKMRCPIFDEVCPTSGGFYRYDPIILLTGSLKQQCKNYITYQTPLAIPATWEDLHAILGTSLAVFVSLVQKSGWTPRLDTRVGQVLESDLSIMFHPGSLGSAPPGSFFESFILPAMKNSELRAVCDLAIAIFSGFPAYLEDRVMLSNFSDEQREFLITAVFLRAGQAFSIFHMEDYLRILLADSTPIANHQATPVPLF